MEALFVVVNVKSINESLRRYKKRWTILILSIVISLMVIYPSRVILSVNRVANDMHALQGRVEQDPMRMLAPATRVELEVLLAQTAGDLHDLRGVLGPLPVVVSYLGWLPLYGGELQSAPVFLEMGEQLISGAQETLRIAEPLMSAMQSDGASGKLAGESMLHVTQDQSLAIHQARENLTAARAARSRINGSRLGASTRQWLDRLDKILPPWRAGLAALELAPSLLGGDRPRVYLFLAQNSDELRATGGFISAAAELRVDRGEIALGGFSDSYAVDNLSRLHPTAPEPLRKYMQAWQWLFRDANWSPDFPTSARVVENIYRIDRDVSVDGVIAVDMQAVAPLLQVVGPVVVDGERVDSSNAIGKIQAAWGLAQNPQRTGEGWSHRKDFAGKVLSAIISRLGSPDLDRIRLARAMYDLVLSKDVLLYLNETGPEEQGGQLWGGVLDTAAANSLMIVDSNVGFNKVSRQIKRQVVYDLSLDRSGEVRAVVTITYTNPSAGQGEPCILQPYSPENYAELQQGCYWNYVRVFVPAGSKFVRAEGVSEPGPEVSFEGRAIFGGYLVVPRSETRSVQFEYRLPDWTSSPYSIRIEKQPGTLPMPVDVQVHLPQGWNASCDGAVACNTGTTLAFAVSLDGDQEIALTLKEEMYAGRWLVLAGALILAGIGVARYRHPRTRAWRAQERP